jgi:hypothetical protein
MAAQRADRLQVSPPQNPPTQPSTLSASDPAIEMLLATAPEETDPHSNKSNLCNANNWLA